MRYKGVMHSQSGLAALEIWCKIYWTDYEKIDVEHYRSEMAVDAEVEKKSEEESPVVDCNRRESSAE
jgi:hypothetical protein